MKVRNTICASLAALIMGVTFSEAQAVVHITSSEQMQECNAKLKHLSVLKNNIAKLRKKMTDQKQTHSDGWKAALQTEEDEYTKAENTFQRTYGSNACLKSDERVKSPSRSRR
ncbi:MAG: hypothetical protein B7Y25_00690 [Alphaproteobacteria bacterium 16-39-46]|nr:MAG: hypothetical protein B7Y25_00690 [Alphaproteobacteria bacterium 16-39-46]OZA44357.1 MAG: hypothetical protein B7X84_00695 [Alphaproteobacteria bacterium 17-39-52]